MFLVISLLYHVVHTKVIDFQHLAIRSSFWDRPSVIGDVLQVYSGKNGRAIIFNETKKEADNLSCSEHIKQDAHVLHGDIPQEKRETVLKVFPLSSLPLNLTLSHPYYYTWFGHHLLILLHVLR